MTIETFGIYPEMSILKLEHAELKNLQNVTQSENALLRSEHSNLKKSQKALHSENVQLRQEVDNLRDAFTKESRSSASNASV